MGEFDALIRSKKNALIHETITSNALDRTV